MKLVRWLAAGLAAGVMAGAAWGQAYPNRPVKIVVPYPPGGVTDLFARALGAQMQESMGQPFLVENRPGASQMVGAVYVAKSPPDGYTLFMGSSGSIAVNPGMYPKLPYDPIRDFAPISLNLKVPFFLVTHPSFPASNVKEVIAHLKANPGKVNFASAGTGASNHLTAEYFMSAAGVKMVHVPYKGSPPAVTDLLAGQVSLMFDTGPVVLPHAKAGRLKVHGVGSVQRAAAAPDLPTIAESGFPGFEAVGWAGYMAPTGTPREIITKLSAEIAKGLQDQALKDRFVALGSEVLSSTPEEFGAYIRSETAKWGKVIKDSGAKAE